MDSLLRKLKIRYYRALYLLPFPGQKSLKHFIENVFSDLPPGHDIDFSPLTVTDMITKIQNHEDVFYTKINHGFWDMLILTKNLLQSKPHLSAKEFELSYEKPKFYSDGFVSELLNVLKQPYGENLYYAASHEAFKNSESHGISPRFSSKELLFQLIEKYRPTTPKHIYDGTMWKNCTFTDDLIKFLTSLNNKHVVIVGPSHLASIGKIFKFKSCTHIEIHPINARKDRTSTANLIRTKAKSFSKEYPVFLIQAGTISPYWILPLSQELQHLAMIDLGMALDVFSPEVLMHTNFGKIFHEKLSKRYAIYEPTWNRYTKGTQ